MSELTSLHMETLAEMGNISMGAAATALSQLLGKKVSITTPRAQLTTVAGVRQLYPVPCVLVRVHYSTGLSGDNLLILTERDCGAIAALMMGEGDKPAPEPLDELHLSAVSEAMNQMMGSSATALSEMFARAVEITPPALTYCDLAQDAGCFQEMDDDSQVVQVAFSLAVEGVLESEMLQLIPVDFALQAAGELLSRLEEQTALPGSLTSGYLEPLEADAISEICNIAMGAAATALSMLVGRRVDITTPRVSITTFSQVRAKFPLPCVVVSVRYQSGLSGENVLIIREHDAALIAGTMMGDAGLPVSSRLDEIQLSAVSEAMNQMMGSAATALSDMFQRQVDISPPETEYKDLSAAEVRIDDYLEKDPLVQVSFRLEVENLLDSELVQLLPVDFAREMVRELMGAMTGAPPLEATLPAPFPPSQSATGAPNGDGRQEALLPGVAHAPFEPTGPAAFPPEQYGSIQLDLIRDIPVKVTGLLGRASLPLKELLQLTAGALVELECPEDAPVEILANGKLVARGEVVRVEEQFGVRITEIVQSWRG